jgi:hypothetical protein
VDDADAERQQEQARERARGELMPGDAEARPANREDRGEEPGGDEEAASGREKWRQRVDDDLDPEVRRGPRRSRRLGGWPRCV